MPYYQVTTATVSDIFSRCIMECLHISTFWSCDWEMPSTRWQKPATQFPEYHRRIDIA